MSINSYPGIILGPIYAFQRILIKNSRAQQATQVRPLFNYKLFINFSSSSNSYLIFMPTMNYTIIFFSIFQRYNILHIIFQFIYQAISNENRISIYSIANVENFKLLEINSMSTILYINFYDL